LDVAKEAFKAGVQQDPENKFYRYNYGSLLLNANELQEAELHFKKALEIDPEYQNALYNLAVTYVKWGAKMREEMEEKEIESDEYKVKFEAALPLLEKYLTINEKEGSVWDLLGKVYANLGMAEKSKEAFNKADMYR
jgi:predicted Zn-dependent protease